MGHIPLSLMRLCSGSSIWMDDHCWLFTSWLQQQILYWGILSFPYRDFVCTVVWWWMIDVGYLPCDFNIKSYIGAYSPSPCRYFVCIVVWGWMVDVGYLPHDFDIRSYTGTYFSIFFEYPWDWNNSQLGFRLSTSMGLPTIDCIRTSLHGFVEIKMDHIRFHPRRIGGSFNQMLLR